ncbi:ceramidase domain-containing protein [Methylopila sp. M107]|uniref:ceramidase domain-containing protein n=1 Tax=Methylopila sp. M107 TaxID=1101190 RepID=UPI0003639800|nr:ceramidase domain-containing protein [Methylopila sp. M107]
MTDWNASVLGVYCERGTDPSFWAEPLNAISNVGFLIAGAILLARSRRDPALCALSIVVLAIGVGSFLFHTLATRAAMLADTTPIQIFIALYFFIAMRRLVGLGVVASAIATVAFAAAAGSIPLLFQAPQQLLGLGGYIGGLAGLVGLALWLGLSGGEKTRAGGYLAAVAGLFAVALTFRTIDGRICELFPIGCHFVWHLLNAVVLYSLVALLLRQRRENGQIPA